MGDGTTAEARLRRLLHVIPAAGRSEGAPLAELAAALDTSTRRILEDLKQVTERAYYHPGGWPDDVNILIDPDRVRVFHATGLERPTRLDATETLCLAIALRGGLAAARLPDGDHRLALLKRAEAHLGAGAWSVEGDPHHAQDRAPDPAGIRETLFAAARSRRPCAIVYARAGSPDVDPRVVHPYVMALAQGSWYVVGWCAVKEGMRVFRVDRILEAAEAEGAFEVPEDFRVGDYVADARVYRAEQDDEVPVRYSPRIARWVRERAANDGIGWTDEPDGSLVLRHRVADPHWVVSHALQYGPDAEILGPPELRAMVRDVVARMAG
jgi:proteasome accessory factor C